jgi:membrane associated rhomboid family serine protease/DNA-directed RNA polymerase subunit RPC12/RpoP
MAPSPDLFVVCKNCRAEVSPYITECPYCGHRLRKRAPKLDKGGVPRPPKKRRRPAAPSLGRLRPGEMPGLRADGRPVAALALVLGAALFTVLLKADILHIFDLTVLGGTGGDWYRPVATSFFYFSTGYELACLAAIFVFGWLLERRHGHWAPLVVYAVGTAAGIGLALLVEPDALIVGGNAGALALLGAWVVRDLAALRRREETDSDLLGIAVIAIVLVLLPAAVEEAHPLAGAGGAIAGLLMGLPLARLRER